MDTEDAPACAAAQVLKGLADKLLVLATEALSAGLPYEIGDTARTMALAFASKQRDHFRSICFLVEAGLDRDADLIARTMLEGTIQLDWAFLEPVERTTMWYWYALVMDWRQIMQNQVEGVLESPERMKLLRETMDEHCQTYFTKDAKAASTNGSALPKDPYRKHWYPGTIASMFGELKRQSTYDDAYRIMSENVHWNPRNLFRSLDYSESHQTVYQSSDARRALSSLVFGFSSMHHTLQHLDTLFVLKLKPRLDALARAFNVESQRA